ncbi:MAG TPA: hypothetical protein VK501_07710 [Baekduia sp.]|uniref:hypothetical protein n=1 Tax=Baekduia sp. TaxID=2600305 RepID=UPI002B856344|nr:hypothetical protein [Baekduia sp.]HMJ33787.1 hypothetical protein [Baekduia sp.]
MRRPASFALTAAAVAALAVAGCGSDSPTSTTTAAVQVPGGAYPAQGISFTAPTGWTVDSGKGALVATAQAGQATVAVWRYPRTQKLPKSQAELKAARDALLKAARKRDVTFEQIKTAPTTIAGKPAVQIRARQHIAGQPRTIRSTHIYANGAEIVIDAYADADSFRKTDAEVFRPLLRSLHVTKPRS